MKSYLLLILHLYFELSFSLCKKEEIREIKYKLKNASSSKKLRFKIKNLKPKLFQEKLLNKHTIMEIESNYIITGIKWEKTDNYNYNYLLGVFEGANDRSFIDGTPIAMIKEESMLQRKKNHININTSSSYKYIRYIPPNKNNTSIIPIKIYGYKKSSRLKNSDDDKYYQITNLPLINIHTEEGDEPIKDSDINCFIKIINEGKLVNNEEAKIKVRGRSTSMTSIKKPFRIEFATKQQIFDFIGKAKKWTLIANYYDRSLLRNSLAFKIAELINFNFTPRCQPVDVVINGNYRGNYYICDKIEVGENRVNISKMEPSDLYGGYLLEIDGLATYYGENPFETTKGIIGNIEYPKKKDMTPEQQSYIFSKLNLLEEEAYNNISDSIDLISYSKFFLVEEFCGDPDHVWSSFYFTKDRNDDRFYFGPVWDFDLAFDNDFRLIPTNNKTDFCFNYCASAGTAGDFINALIRNKNVIGSIKQIWEELCERVLNVNILLDYIEEKRNYIKESAKLNFLKWDPEDQSPSPYKKNETFEESIEIVKDYIKGRFNSLSNLINNATKF
jgi:hypothetical protein